VVCGPVYFFGWLQGSFTGCSRVKRRDQLGANRLNVLFEAKLDQSVDGSEESRIEDF
jgi:hypothetical protein